MTTTNPTLVHPFEKTLGAGPYRCVGMVTIKKPTAANPVANYKQCWDAAGPRFKEGMGTCAHCGTAIMDVFFVQVGNGDIYGVGCDCIGKVSCKGSPLKTQADKLRLAAARKKRHTAKVDQKQAIIAALELHADKFLQLPHPRGFDGKTFADYVEWMVGNCGAAGIKRLYPEVMAAANA